MHELRFDVLFIGAGPAGYVGAIRAAQLGLKTALVESKHLGGICLNWGCIPTKSLLQSANIYRMAKHADIFGVRCNKVDFDLNKIVQRSRLVVKQLNTGISHLLKKNSVTLINGKGVLNGNRQVHIVQNDGDEIVANAPHIVLATGARTRPLPGINLDTPKIWTSREALTPEEIPKSLLVIGSGAIGVEFASFYNTFGSEITVVEMLDQILPTEDSTVTDIAQKMFERRGIKFLLSSKVSELRSEGEQIVAKIDQNGQSQALTFNRVISCIGVVPNVEDLGLQVAGVKLSEKGFVHIDDICRTTVDGIYAVGDVAGGPCLAHKASHEAIHCVEHIVGIGNMKGIDRSEIPNCVYSHPQVASVGLSEQRAREIGYDLKVGVSRAIGNGKSLVIDETVGVVKTIFNAQNGELLGAHIVGPEASEMIQNFVVAKSLETTELDLMRTVFPHPTLSEMSHESVLNAYGIGIHG